MQYLYSFNILECNGYILEYNIYSYNILEYILEYTGNNADQNGGWHPILGAYFGLKPKM